jgi:hypothetical protein
MTKSKWTPELDAKLIELIKQAVSSEKASRQLGISAKSVKRRSTQLGLRFVRNPALTSAGHIPADQKSAELLRAAGVPI